MAKAKLAEVSVNLAWLQGKWVVDESQRRAAWEMYVELITRVSLETLGDGEGSLREALSSLHELFTQTRLILRAHGPSVAIPEKKKLLSFGAIAVDALNSVLRPVLAKWHPRLADHEARRLASTSLIEHENSWARAKDFRADLDAARRKLVAYADVLAEACNVPALHSRPEP